MATELVLSVFLKNVDSDDRCAGSHFRWRIGEERGDGKRGLQDLKAQAEDFRLKVVVQET